MISSVENNYFCNTIFLINFFFQNKTAIIMNDILLVYSRGIMFIGRPHNNASQKFLDSQFVKLVFKKLKLIVNVCLITHLEKKLQSDYHRPFVYDPFTMHVYHVKSNTFCFSVRFVP